MKKVKLIFYFVFVIFCFAEGVDASGIDANDFAWQVINYSPGLGAGWYTYPQAALGKPAVDTDFYGSNRPVVPVFQQWKPTDVVTVGVGGQLVLKFNHKVCDDLKNPYGFDFIVFGNAMFIINGSSLYDYSDPCSIFLKSGQVRAELGKVSVSQDGTTWFSFDDGPYADTFAPTLGRIFDPNNPAYYPGWENLWWSDEADPTLPLDPNIDPSDFAGKSLSDVCFAYGKSAGGTAFDLKKLADFNSLTIDPNSGQRWIQYIKVECIDTNSDGLLPEVDAVSDVSGCGDYKHPFPSGDINRDCCTDSFDLEILSRNWLTCIDNLLQSEQSADLFQDSDRIINFKDLVVLAAGWLENTWP